MSEERYDTGYILDNLFRASWLLQLNAGEFEVLCALVRHDCPDPRNGGNRKEDVWPSPRGGLHDYTGRPRQTLQRILDSLERKGAITCLTPDNKGGRYHPHHWRPNYQAMGWKFPEPKRPQSVALSEPKRPQSVALIRESDSESRNPPPPDPPPSSQPAGSPLAPSPVEEEEFSFLSPDERACLQSLQVSPALWQRVQQSEPGLVQSALQHLLSRREEILAQGRTLEERFGGLLTGRFVPSPEKEIPAQEEEAPVCWYLCQTCGITYTGEHRCALTGKEEPQGEGDRWLQEMKERVEKARQEVAPTGG
jgi:hypothetical protein